jgi:hypothetical protein
MVVFVSRPKDHLPDLGNRLFRVKAMGFSGKF